MKPNAEQIETIEDILGSVSKYRETYEELYDHILSALDPLPDGVDFVDALYHIVENELGGKRGITQIENRYRKAAIKEVGAKYFRNFGRYLASPIMVLVIALTALLYGAMINNMVNMNVIVTFCFILNTGLAIARKRFIVKARDNGTYGKSSVITVVYPWIATLPMWLFCVAMLAFYLISFLTVLPLFTTLPYIILGIFFINLINMLTYYSLLKDEFKGITTN